MVQLAIQRFLASNKTSSVLASYVKERKNMSSFYGFLPFSKAWNGLEAAWITRFLRAVKEFIPESYKALEKRVCIFILIKIKSSKKGAPGRLSCLSGVFSCRVDSGVSNCRVGRHHCDLHSLCLDLLENSPLYYY